MPILDPKSNTTTVSALMNDPNMSKVIGDALNAPAGSTQREKAAAMLRSFGANKLTNLMDPTGGLLPPGAPSAPAVPGAMPAPAPSAVATAPSIPQVDTTQAPEDVVEPQTFMLPSAPARREKTDQGEYIPNEEGLQNIREELGSMGIPKSEWADYITKDPSGKLFYKKPSTKWTPKEGYEKIDSPDQVPQYESVERDPGTGDMWGQPTVEMDTEKYKASLDEEDLQGWEKIIQEAVDAGVGADTFTWQVREDRNKLKSLAKFSGLPEEAMDVFEGAGLAQHVEDLEKTLKSEFKVNALEDNLSKLQERGLTIEDDITDYMTARDQYVSQLDKMILATKDSMVTADMANPYVKKRMGNYLNYLYVTKGRHQKRYADFVSDGIKQHNLELTRAQNAYDSAFDKFDSALKSKTEIAKEDYGRFDTMISNMYGNLENAEREEYEIGILEQRWLEAQFDNAKLALEVADEIEGIEPDIDFSPADLANLQAWDELYDIARWPDEWKNVLVKSGLSDAQVRRFLRALRDKEEEEQQSIDPMIYLEEWAREEDKKAGSITNPFATQKTKTILKEIPKNEGEEDEKKDG